MDLSVFANAYLGSVFGLMVMGVFAEIRNGFECFCKCIIFVFQIWVKKNSVVFWYFIKSLKTSAVSTTV